MPTKQIKVIFQANPTSDQDVTLQIAVDDETKFNQQVPAMGPAQQGIPDPTENIEFDLDMANATANAFFTNLAFSITAINGRAKIETLQANFTMTANLAGYANGFVTCDIVSQPLWNGTALLERYNLEYNRGPEQITGPGEVQILAGETVTFDVQVPNWNDSLPLPP